MIPRLRELKSGTHSLFICVFNTKLAVSDIQGVKQIFVGPIGRSSNAILLAF